MKRGPVASKPAAATPLPSRQAVSASPWPSAATSPSKVAPAALPRGRRSEVLADATCRAGIAMRAGDAPSAPPGPRRRRACRPRVTAAYGTAPPEPTSPIVSLPPAPRPPGDRERGDHQRRACVALLPGGDLAASRPPARSKQFRRGAVARSPFRSATNDGDPHAPSGPAGDRCSGSRPALSGSSEVRGASPQTTVYVESPRGLDRVAGDARVRTAARARTPASPHGPCAPGERWIASSTVERCRRSRRSHGRPSLPSGATAKRSYRRDRHGLGRPRS